MKHTYDRAVADNKRIDAFVRKYSAYDYSEDQYIPSDDLLVCMVRVIETAKARISALEARVEELEGK